MMIQGIQNEVQAWRQILHRVIDVVLFLGERGLAFHEISDRIGDINNGNFFGILELISHYDHIWENHFQKVKNHQCQFSSAAQNELIACCSNKVVSELL